MEMRVSRVEQSQCGILVRNVAITEGSRQEVVSRSTSGEERGSWHHPIVLLPQYPQNWYLGDF